MTPETLIALRASIAHHEENLKATDSLQVVLSPQNCALCGLFWNAPRDIDGVHCGECPVKLKTGCEGCEGSPFDALSGAHHAWDNCEREEDSECREAFLAACRAEIEFLRSLLPEGEK